MAWVAPALRPASRGRDHTRDIRTFRPDVPRPYVPAMNDHHRAFEGGRVFVVGFATLAACFSGLGLYYLANPRGAIAALSAANQRLGGIPIVVVDVPAWRYTAAVG